MLRLNRKAQSTAEYVIVLGLIVAAVIAMQTYVKRGLQGRIKEAVDYVGEESQTAGVANFSGAQYEPYYLSSTFNNQRTSDETENLLDEGAVERRSQETSTRSGSQTIGAVTQE